ncbi:hypothetical protein NT6N_35820 [Oceaniferula spumae]|uniref:Uncharacterized protein n=1 Tax=Oceaniferula spumae TaxID=2979115 RepID=A0AAT9FQW6_9BACT
MGNRFKLTFTAALNGLKHSIQRDEGSLNFTRCGKLRIEASLVGFFRFGILSGT